MSLLSAVRHITKRRKILRDAINIEQYFSDWEETCVPSYCHKNLIAAYISWWRLFKSAQLAKTNFLKSQEKTYALDFGSSVGELGHLISKTDYHFIEEDDAAAQQLLSALPKSTRCTLTNLPTNFYDVIFALDSLEHNSNYEQLLGQLLQSLKENGVLILSGPTESFLYKLGRKIAGFEGHYHETNIYAIEDSAKKMLSLIHVSSLPICTPLFRISVWRKLPDITSHST